MAEDRNVGNLGIFKQKDFNWKELQAAAGFHAQCNMDETTGYCNCGFVSVTGYLLDKN